MLGHLVLSHHDADAETRFPPPLPFRWIAWLTAVFFRRR